MDFELTVEQQMLRETARDFLSAECPKTLVRDMVEDRKGYSPDLWKKIVALGWMGLAFPEDCGGTGGSFLDLCVLLEETGRACLPGPFFVTVFGGMLILNLGSESQKKRLVPRIADGDLVVTMAPLRTSPKNVIAGGIEAETEYEGNGHTISGICSFVPHAHVADLIICAASTQKGIKLFPVSPSDKGVSCTVLNTIAGDKQCEVRLEEVKVPQEGVLGESACEWRSLEAEFAKAVVGKCAEMVGGAQQVLEMTVDYAKQRTQFGQHIGSFQVIQHYCADMLTDVDACRFITYDAAWKVSAGLPYVRASSIAKAWVNEAYRRVIMKSHQIHAAMGLSEDYDLGLYTRRSRAAELMLGDTEFHREMIAHRMGL